MNHVTPLAEYCKNKHVFNKRVQLNATVLFDRGSCGEELIYRAARLDSHLASTAHRPKQRSVIGCSVLNTEVQL